MKDKKTTSNPGGSEGTLDTPFAQLMGQFPEAPATAGARVEAAKPALAFCVGRTRKGGYPVSLEKRPGGKTMTIIRNVSGDADALLTLLKKRCAAGGKAFEDWVEVQGDHCDKVQALLKDMGL